MLTDHHSHILPGIDDGAKNVEMSLEMIRALKQQGVERIVATPHFYAHREDGIDAYLQKRQHAFDTLMAHSPATENCSGYATCWTAIRTRTSSSCPSSRL